MIICHLVPPGFPSSSQVQHCKLRLNYSELIPKDTWTTSLSLSNGADIICPKAMARDKQVQNSEGSPHILFCLSPAGFPPALGQSHPASQAQVQIPLSVPPIKQGLLVVFCIYFLFLNSSWVDLSREKQ